MAGGTDSLLHTSSSKAEVVHKEPLFPNRLYMFVFAGYIILFVNQGLLVTASKDSAGNYSYNTTTVVLLTELCKLLAASLIYLNEKSLRDYFKELRSHMKVLALYLIPAFLYCLYNNLAFTNLKHYDPATYFLLLNFRTVVTGVLFELIFKKRLSLRQWVALIVLTVGCIIKQVRLDQVNQLSIQLDFHLVLIMAQVFCSCFAGVFNEFLLKDSGSVNIHIMMQNVFMYVDSVLMNVGFLAVNGELGGAFTQEALGSIFKVIVLAIIVNNAAAGIVTSVFLKKFNSILKAFTAAIDLTLTALLSWLFFGIAIHLSLLLSIAFVSYALYLYSTDPVVNKPTKTAASSDHLADDANSKA